MSEGMPAITADSARTEGPSREAVVRALMVLIAACEAEDAEREGEGKGCPA